MKLFSFIIFIFMAKANISSGQHLALTFQDTERNGLSIKQLDSIYKSALNVDTSRAVFKTDSDQEKMGNAYVKLLLDFGKYLSANKFYWERVTKCYNRIYFNSDGSVDYFIYNFLGKPEDKPSEETEKQFKVLLNQFIKDYKIAMTADVKFVQCSPATYNPKSKEK